MKCVIFCFGLLLSLFHATSGNEACSTAKPDFKAPGRRISEEKCREYNWVRKCSSQDGEVNKHPYMGAIAFKREGEVKFMCNAFLISPKFAVTAAHCVRGAQHSIPEFVRFGNKNLNDVPVTDAKIISTIVHPEYTPAKISFDIALLVFERALLVNQAVAPACLWPEPEVTTNQDLQVPGWASTEEDSKIEVLRTMTVQAIDSKTCEPLIQQYYNRIFMKLADHHLCVNESDTKNYFYRGSSGAPIVTPVPLGDGDEMPYVQAFASFGFTRNKERPRIGFYVKIASFIDWIEQTVWS